MSEAQTTPALDDPFGVLRRVLRPRERLAPGERCDMCGEALPAADGPGGERHSHVANIGERRLLCTCRGCYLLFTAQGAGGLRMRAVPEDYRRLDLALTQQQWDALAVPVDLVFLFRQSAQSSDETGESQTTRMVACYPSPAGATESEVDADDWEAIVAGDPAAAALADDVQALLIRRTGEGEFACLLVPVDACYELVGLVRIHWTGFGGGSELWRRIDAFFAQLAERAR